MARRYDPAIHSELDASAMTRMQKVLPALALIYLVASAANLFAGSADRGVIPGCLAYATATAFITFRILGRHKWIPPHRVFLISSASAVLILAGSLARLYWAFDVSQFAVILLLLIGSAGTLGSRRCFALI